MSNRLCVYLPLLSGQSVNTKTKQQQQKNSPRAAATRRGAKREGERLGERQTEARWSRFFLPHEQPGGSSSGRWRGRIRRPVSSGINRHRSCCRPAQLLLKQEDREREKRFCSELSRPNLHIPVISAFCPTSTLTENCVLSSWGVSSV